MSTAANPNAYPGSPWNRPEQQQAWGPAPGWVPSGMEKPLGIAAMVLGFIFFWPVGLAILFFLLFSGRLGCRRRWSGGPNGPAEWRPITPPWMNPAWTNWCRPAEAPRTSSGNHAFDEYRSETLRRLEEEQAEFAGFLERLRFAKDKAEFDQFMAERRQAPPRPPAEPPQA